MMGGRFASPYIDKLRLINPLQQSLPIRLSAISAVLADMHLVDLLGTSYSSDDPLSSASTAEAVMNKSWRNLWRWHMPQAMP